MMCNRPTQKQIEKIACCVLLAALILLQSLAPALAWADFSQNKSNLFLGTVRKSSAVLRKYEISPSGKVTGLPVRGAVFELYRLRPGEEPEQIGGSYTTDRFGEITVKNLMAGNYVFVETTPGYGYGYALDEHRKAITEYPFSITAEDALGYALVEVEAYNLRLTGGLEVTKQVVNADGSPLTEEQLAAEFAFLVSFSDGESYPYQLNAAGPLRTLDNGKLWLKHGETAVFREVPVGVYYTVTETRPPGYTVQSNNSQGSIQLDSLCRAEFVNIFGTVSSGECVITVEKIVAGEPPEADKDREFRFTFRRNNETPVKFTLKAGEQKRFRLLAGDSYSVTEDDPFDFGYLLAAAVNSTGTAGAQAITVTFVNLYINTARVTISGEKTWKLNGADASSLPESITVVLKSGGEVIQLKTVRPGDDGKWRYAFTVPKFDADGNEIVYTIAEVPVAGFTGDVKGYNLINQQIPPVKASPPSVKKTIKGHTPERPEEFSFVLTALNGGPMPPDAQDGAKTITLSGAREKSFGAIAFDAPGEYRYEIRELDGGAEGYTYDSSVYTLTYTVTEQNGVLKAQRSYTRDGSTQSYAKAEFVNHFRKPGRSDETLPGSSGTQPGNPGTSGGAGSTIPLTTTVPVAHNSSEVHGSSMTAAEPEMLILSGQKTWEHGSNPQENWPKRITVYVMQGSRIAAEAVVTAEDDWSYRFRLPRFEADGTTEILYTIEEGNVPQYTHTVAGSNLTNTFKSQDYPGDTPPRTGVSRLVQWTSIAVMSLTGLILLLLRKRKTAQQGDSIKAKEC